MSRARRLLLGGAGIISYLLRDDFNTPDAAPVSSPRNADPGPGTMTVTDTAGTLAITGGELVFPAAASRTAVGDPGVWYEAQTRAVGLGAFFRVRISGAGNPIWSAGWDSNQAGGLPSGFYFINAGTMRIFDNSQSDLLDTYSSTSYDVAVVARTPGTLILIKGGAFANWTLLWPGVNLNSSPIYASAGVVSVSATAEIGISQARVAQLPGAWQQQNGLAALYVAAPADATEYTAAADGILSMTVTAPGSLDGSATTRCGFYYRADADLSPAWHAYVDGTGAFNLDSIDAGGTRTNRATAAGVITGGATLIIRVNTNGALHRAYTRSGTTWTNRGGLINVSLNDAVTRVVPSIPAGWSASNLDSYARTSTAYSVLDRYFA